MARAIGRGTLVTPEGSEPSAGGRLVGPDRPRTFAAHRNTGPALLWSPDRQPEWHALVRMGHPRRRGSAARRGGKQRRSTGRLDRFGSAGSSHGIFCRRHRRPPGFSRDRTAPRPVRRRAHADRSLRPRVVHGPRSHRPGARSVSARAFQALNAGDATMVAMHWGTFQLTDEPMDEPPKRATAAWANAGLDPRRLWIPSLGETRRWPLHTH